MSVFEDRHRIVEWTYLLLQVVFGVWVQCDFDGILDLRLHDNSKVEVQVERAALTCAQLKISNERASCRSNGRGIAVLSGFVDCVVMYSPSCSIEEMSRTSGG